MQMKVVHEVTQRCSDIRRTPGEQADQSERSEGGVLAEQEPEVLAAGPRNTVSDESGACRIADQIVRTSEQAGVEPYLAQDRGRVCAEVPEDLGNRHHRADPD